MWRSYAALGKRKRALSDYAKAAGLAPKNPAINKAHKAAQAEGAARVEAKKQQKQPKQPMTPRE